MKRLFIAALALALSACGASTETAVNSAATVAAGSADALGAKPPVILAGTAVDEKAAIALLSGYDAFLFVVDTLDAAGALPPTSPKVQALANAIDTTTGWLRVALAAQKAGNATSYTEALSHAKAAYAEAQQTLGSN